MSLHLEQKIDDTLLEFIRAKSKVTMVEDRYTVKTSTNKIEDTVKYYSTKSRMPFSKILSI